jgi:hypothetical protein
MKDSPEYLIQNFENISKIADVIFEKPNNKRKKQQSEDEISEDSDEEIIEKSVKKKQKKTNPYNEFVKNEYQKTKDECDDNTEIFKIIADKWKTSSENPKNV